MLHLEKAVLISLIIRHNKTPVFSVSHFLPLMERKCHNPINFAVALLFYDLRDGVQSIQKKCFKNSTLHSLSFPRYIGGRIVVLFSLLDNTFVIHSVRIRCIKLGIHIRSKRKRHALCVIRQKWKSM